MSGWKVLGKLSTVKPEERIDEIMSIILNNRGIKSNRDYKKFIEPDNPFNIDLSDLGVSKTQIDIAAARILKAINNKESIVIYGDYDCDGITATAILWETLFHYSKTVMPYIPNRIDEGYGLSRKGINKVISDFNPSLIITVDHGVTAKEEIEYAKSRKIDIIVTDHHTLPQIKPNPYSLIHCTKISGSALAWFFAKELVRKLHVGNYQLELKEKLSLCAIGTITDLLPLKDENRSIVNFGLQQLRKTKRPGMLEIFSLTKILKDEIDTHHVAFIIGPRINSTGRLTQAMDSLRLICTKSTSQARKLATEIESINKERQKITLNDYSLVKQLINPSQPDKLIFIQSPNLNQGVIGLVAGKLVDDFYKPAIVICVGKSVSKASARSIAGFNIISAIRDASEFLIDCGGHPLAAGFTIRTDKIDLFKKKIFRIVNKQLIKSLLTEPVVADCQLQMSDLTLNLFQKLSLLKPFGFGNKEPLFLTDSLNITQARVVGSKGNHLKLKLKHLSGQEYEAIAFNKAHYYKKITKEGTSRIIYALALSKFYDNRLELKIREIKEMF